MADAQQGAVKRAQLVEAGVSRHTVDRRGQNGDLHRIHRGVYIVGHTALAPLGSESAALLACGERALISHRSAAHLWSLLDDPPAEIDITVVGRRCRPKEGVRIHLAGRMDRRDTRRKSELLLTAPARTLIDLAADGDELELERALTQACACRLLRDAELERALDRAGQRPGVGRIRALLRREGGPALTRSEAERVLLELIRDARLPAPAVNAPVLGFEVDFLWPAQRLIVEVDGYAFHGHRAAFERDRRRDVLLGEAGYHVVRVTYRQLLEEPLTVVAHIARMLERRA